LRGRTIAFLAKGFKQTELREEVVMAEIVVFPTDAARYPSEARDDELSGDRFLLDEGLDLLADYRAITDPDVRASLRALARSMALRCRHAPQ
jgi:hypothetical protein